MARSIVLSRAGATSSFAFKKIDRARLYGRRRRIPLDPAGEACTRAALTEDGSLILRQGMTAQGYFDHDDHWVPQGELVGLDEHGEPLERRTSTLGREVELEGPLDPRDVLDVRTRSVYLLSPEDVDDGLREALEAGSLFRFPFVYRESWEDSWAWLVANPDGDLFALVGERVEPVWSEPHVLPAEETDDDDLDDELDFEMF
ncbi:MAG: hypothetical protein AAGE94_23950 [Acidobacteriota bacterium]